MGADNDKTLLDECERMFQFWCSTESFVDTAETFHISRPTLQKIAVREKWQERYDKIKGRIQKFTATDVVNVIKGNLEYVRAVKRKLLLTILGRTQLEGTISELIKLMEYEDKLIGAFPADAGGNQTNNFIVQIINGLDTTERDQLDRNLRAYFGNGIRRPNGRSGVIDEGGVTEVKLGAIPPPDSQESNS